MKPRKRCIVIDGDVVTVHEPDGKRRSGTLSAIPFSTMVDLDGLIMFEKDEDIPKKKRRPNLREGKPKKRISSRPVRIPRKGDSVTPEGDLSH